MTDYKHHTILVYDTSNNFKHSLTFDSIFSITCVNTEVDNYEVNGFKYKSKEGFIFNTKHYKITPHKDYPNGTSSGHTVYHATETGDICSICTSNFLHQQ